MYLIPLTDCGDPVPENGVALGASGTVQGDSTVLGCNTGYDLVGAEVVTCLETGWNATSSCIIQSE